MIKHTSDGWCATTLDADITAHLDADTITVRLDDTGQAWNAECSGPIRQAVIKMGGFALALTTAFNPAELRELHQFLGPGEHWPGSSGMGRPCRKPTRTAHRDCLLT